MKSKQNQHTLNNEKKEKLSYSFEQIVNNPKVAIEKLEEEEHGNNNKDLKMQAVALVTFTHFVQTTGQVMESIPTYIEVNKVNRKLIRTSGNVITNQELERLIKIKDNNSNKNKNE